MSSPPPASPPMVWPPSNPSGTVIPFPLPWGQTGCCPPGGMDALMKCYCDIQQASAFIGQIMLDQINNNPAIIAAIIAGIEKSGSSLPLIGVTDGSAAQPGQVGEYVQLVQIVPYTTAGLSLVSVSMGVLQPGDWAVWAELATTTLTGGTFMVLNPTPVGFSGSLAQELAGAGMASATALVSGPIEANIAVPTLVVLQINVVPGSGQTAGNAQASIFALRVR